MSLTNSRVPLEINLATNLFYHRNTFNIVENAMKPILNAIPIRIHVFYSNKMFKFSIVVLIQKEITQNILNRLMVYGGRGVEAPCLFTY